MNDSCKIKVLETMIKLIFESGLVNTEYEYWEDRAKKELKKFKATKDNDELIILKRFLNNSAKDAASISCPFMRHDVCPEPIIMTYPITCSREKAAECWKKFWLDKSEKENGEL